MGTRSLTIIQDMWTGEPEEIVVMYRQMDGYPSGHGADLAQFLNGMVVGNGISHNSPAKYANGASCLAAQIVAHFKNESGVGGIYLHPAGTEDIGEEFVYYVKASDSFPIRLDVIEKGWGEEIDKLLFQGTPEDFLVGLEKGVYE